MAEETKREQRPEVVQSSKRVRAFLGGKAVADSKNTLLLRAQGQLPVYYFPVEDVRMEWLTQAAPGTTVAEQGEGPWPDPPEEATLFTVQVGDATAENAAWRVEEAATEHRQLAGHIAFAWQAMDAWYEEDHQIRVHPHDPYHLIDGRPSSRHIRVLLKGQVIAETKRPVMLFETGLPARYYIPKMDVDMERLSLSNKTTHCAYKGTAPHYNVEVNGETVDNIAWHYPFPNYQYAPIQNMIAFYQERVDEFYDDGARVR